MTIDEYILQHIDPEGDYLYRLFRATNIHTIHGRMASGHLQGRLLKMLVRMIRPKNILEVGTFSGYSAISMAEGLEGDGHLYTFEINDEMEDFTRPWIEGSSVADRITFLIGDALGSQAVGKRFQRRADFKDFIDVPYGHSSHIGATAGHHDDISLQLQLADSFAHRSAGYAQFFCQLYFHDTLARLKDAVADGLPQRFTYNFPQGLIAVQLDGRKSPVHNDSPILHSGLTESYLVEAGTAATGAGDKHICPGGMPQEACNAQGFAFLDRKAEDGGTAAGHHAHKGSLLHHQLLVPLYDFILLNSNTFKHIAQ